MSLIASLTSPAGLRRVLAFDALSGAATGALQLGLTGLLSQWLGISEALLQGAGIAIFAFVALAAWLALQATPPRGALAVLVIGNLAWVAGCLALVFGGAPGVTGLGVGYLLFQAVVVLVLAELQWMGLRRHRLVLAV
ncbi:MAG: hypothetical protein AB7S86_04825 [Hydrogenophaga sp.]|uniref:hypothetical protein n=1 Tax=Hydrogenophaga sp. TaxID=1904254 RepID=UPI003D0CA9C1